MSEPPSPPFPAQPIEPPGLEADMDPAPRWRAPFYRGSGKLEDEVALITGGDSGIGRSVAVLFAREGADVAITHIPEEREDAEAPAYVYLGSADSSYVTGEVLTLLGGETRAG